MSQAPKAEAQAVCAPIQNLSKASKLHVRYHLLLVEQEERRKGNGNICFLNSEW